LPAALDARAQHHGFELVVRADDDAAARVSGFAAALAQIVGVPARVRVLDPGVVPEPWPGLRLQLGCAADRERKLRGLLSSLEGFALRR
jgi:hypothetical protein